jgi:molecular chaperone GrpE (heat shock protein)
MNTYNNDSDIEDTGDGIVTGTPPPTDEVSDDSHDIDIAYEEEEGPDTLKLKHLREKLKQAVREKQEYLDGWQRAKADFVNYKKDQEVLHSRLKEVGKEAMIHDLLSVADSFEMAFGNKDVWERVDENWRRGVEYIYAQFGKVLDDHGIIIIDPLGEHFDPTRHAAAEVVSVDDAAYNDIVVTVLQKGYVMNNKVLRPARVRVGAYAEK